MRYHQTAQGVYRGWHIGYRPVGSQHWRAVRHGVSLCSPSPAALRQMIDLRTVDDRQEWPR